jgi:hypothetical protein
VEPVDGNDTHRWVKPCKHRSVLCATDVSVATNLNLVRTRKAVGCVDVRVSVDDEARVRRGPSRRRAGRGRGRGGLDMRSGGSTACSAGGSRLALVGRNGRGAGCVRIGHAQAHAHGREREDVREGMRLGATSVELLGRLLAEGGRGGGGNRCRRNRRGAEGKSGEAGRCKGDEEHR